MKYGDFIHFEALDDSVRLTDAGDAGAAQRLVDQLILPPALAGRLRHEVIPHLSIDSGAEGRIVFVSGAHGAGRSHLLGALGAIAERAELAEAYLGPEAGLSHLAGRFKVLRAAPGQDDHGVRGCLLDRLEGFLGGLGITYRFPRTSRLPARKPTFAEMMAAFHGACPEQGLLLQIDDLPGCLTRRSRRGLADDLAFLQELAHACRALKLRVMLSAPDASPPPHGEAAGDDPLRHVRRLGVDLRIDLGDAVAIAASRVVRKTPGQRARARAHLARFAYWYSELPARMEEFVDAFPLHPDYARLFEHGMPGERRGVLRCLSDAVARHLDEEVPEILPGLIAYDSYWDVARENPMARKSPELAAVIDYSRQLDQRVETSSIPAEERPMARRIIRALSVQRLRAGDVYGPRGESVSDLRDALCLFRPGLDAGEASPADALAAAVGRVIDAIRTGVREPVVELRTHEGRHYLHFKKFRRFHGAEVVLHWINALPFLALLATGAMMLVSRFSHLDRQTLTWTVGVHKCCAVFWLCAMPIAVFVRFRPHWENLRTLVTWGPADAVWMIQSVRSLYNRRAIVPPAGRFNTGQKINACLVVLYFFAFAATGAVMWWRGTILFPWYIHAALFCMAVGSVGGHLYLALVNPSTRIALGGIFHGWAPMKYIEHHHALSLPASARAHDHGKPAGLRSLAAEILYSRIELAVLVVSLLLGGAGAYAFTHGRVEKAKRQFSKSFADLIQPSELSTKHRLGPAAESCTKCHLYTGQIPDAKCEACHENVKARRDAQLGYHGTLKGDCRYCHREHRSETASLVPLNRETFKHSEAAFPLDGKHAAVKCDACHQRPRPPDSKGIYYLELPHERCTDCHRDRHAGQFTNACTSCHSPAGWTGPALNFDHNTRAAYRLEGRHAALDCRKCHTPPAAGEPLGAAKFKGLPQTCAGCHQDPHRAQFETRCTACHSPAGWTRDRLDFQHDQDTKFPLVAKHAQVACEKCHPPAKAGDPLARAQFVGLKQHCADCHQDPHGGQFARDCTRCHPGPVAWKVGAPQFVHDRDTKFTLIGHHAQVACAKCHTPAAEGRPLASAQFKGLGTACADCHAVKHPAEYGTSCTSCHAPDHWPRREPAFEHTRDTGFELVGKHRTAACSACHNPQVFGAIDRAQLAKFSCAGCHRKDEPHQGVLGDDCARCHAPPGWKGDDLVFDHNSMARFTLDRNHDRLACAKCHANGHWKPVDPSCASCHTKFFKDPPK